MRWKPRISWAVRWGGLAAAVVIAGVWVASGLGWAQWTSRRSSAFVIIVPGSVVISPIGPTHPAIRRRSVITRPSSDGPIGWWVDWWRVRPGGPIEWVQLPLWMPLTLVTVPTGLAWRGWFRTRRRERIGKCRGCGYDLAGLAGGTGVCPECGRAGTE
jgi:hypothetical protein